MTQKSKKIIAIDIGGTNIRIGLVDSLGNLEKNTKLDKPDISQVPDLIISTIKDLFTKSELENTSCIAVSTAGRVDNEKGLIECPTIGKGVLPLGRDLKEVFGKEVILINDANVAAYGEYSKIKDKTQNLVYVTISTGIGGGAIVDGYLIQNNAVEIGHIVVKEEDYKLFCNYGHENCWEAFASGNGIPHFFKAWAKKQKITAENYSAAGEIFEAAKKGGQTEKKFLEKLGEYNSRGISMIMAAYNPDIIVIGGSVVRHNKNEILKPMMKNIQEIYKLPQIIVTESGDEVCLLGAAQYAFDNLVKEKK